MNFVADSKGLYILDKEKPNECHAQVEGFSQREIARAKKTRRLYRQLVAPSVAAFKSLLRKNLIRNCEVMENYIELTDEVFGPDVPTLKGKITRPKPRKVVDEGIEIPDEFVARNKNLELAINIMFINKEKILTTIDGSIMFKACVPLPSREDGDIFRGLDEILRHFNKGGYTITKIHADGEFESLLLRIKDDLDIKINVVNPDEHVGDIERLNRTIREKFRTRYYRLPFKAIPKVMINALACVTTYAMNLFPVKGGVSKYFSPHIILGKKQLH